MSLWVASHRRRKRILYLDHTAAMGGGEIALLNLLQHLDCSEFEPVVALFADGPFTNHLRRAGFETHILPLAASIINTRKESLRGRGLLRFGDLLPMLRHIHQLSAFIRAGRFDLVHTNSLKSDIIGGIAGKMAGRTVLWHIRDRIDPDYLPRPAVSLFRTACRLLPDFVVANSMATLNSVLPPPGDGCDMDAAHARMRVVHDGVVQHAFVECKAPVSEFVSVGLVGRISPFKGQDVFIRAAAMVLKHHPNCRFKVIGAALFNEDGYERDIHGLVRELNLENAVEFTGFRNDVTTAIAELDLLVHASVTGEPFGQVIVEGMAAGKPVVATNGGGVPEIVQHGTTGLLVPMRDDAAMAHAICQLLTDRDGAREMGRRGRRRVWEHFRIEHTAEKIASFYQHIFQRRLREFT